jgi:hypothetical protein
LILFACVCLRVVPLNLASNPRPSVTTRDKGFKHFRDSFSVSYSSFGAVDVQRLHSFSKTFGETLLLLSAQVQFILSLSLSRSLSLFLSNIHSFIFLAQPGSMLYFFCLSLYQSGRSSILFFVLFTATVYSFVSHLI